MGGKEQRSASQVLSTLPTTCEGAQAGATAPSFRTFEAVNSIAQLEVARASHTDEAADGAMGILSRLGTVDMSVAGFQVAEGRGSDFAETLFEARLGLTQLAQESDALRGRTVREGQADEAEVAGVFAGAGQAAHDALDTEAFKAPLHPEEIWYDGLRKGLTPPRGGPGATRATDLGDTLRSWADWVIESASPWQDAIAYRREVVAWVQREMQRPDGMFSALNLMLDPHEPAPHEHFVGRQRQYLDALAQLVAGDTSEVPPLQSEGQTLRQVRMLDMDPSKRDRVFDLEEAARAATRRAHQGDSDQDVLDELHRATDNAERRFLLATLIHMDSFDDKKAMTLVREYLDGDELETFEAYMAKTSDFSSGLSQEVEGGSIWSAGLEGVQAAPGAIVGTAWGGATAVPILGDLAKKYWGGDVEATILHMHHFMGVEDQGARASLMWSSLGGSIAMSIGLAKAGASGLKILRDLEGGVAAYQTLNAAHKARVIAGAAITAGNVAKAAHDTVAPETLAGGKASLADRVLSAVAMFAGVSSGMSAARGATDKAGGALAQALAPVTSEPAKAIATQAGYANSAIKAITSDPVGSVKNLDSTQVDAAIDRFAKQPGTRGEHALELQHNGSERDKRAFLTQIARGNEQDADIATLAKIISSMATAKATP
ncbi:MAG: hypothetical protein AB8H79_18485 [Myxococcota bacterium]